MVAKLTDSKLNIFESFNIYKSVLIEKLIIQTLKTVKPRQKSVDICTIYAELINDKETYLGKNKIFICFRVKEKLRICTWEA